MEPQFNDGFANVSALADGATTDAEFSFEGNVDPAAADFRLIARCLVGTFETGELVEFDIPARVG